jgi:hemolysin III
MDHVPQIKKAERLQTPAEELANSITHGIGLLLSVACLTVGVVFAALRRNPWTITSVSIYGATLCVLYLSSTLYHSARSPRAKFVWNVLDHSAIYLLIAGTYTPFTLGPLREHGGLWGWGLFGITWALALAGVAFQALFIHRWRVFSTMTYLLMGWIVVFAVYPLWRTIGPGGLLWLASGGLCYTLGVAFYSLKQIPFMHAVWHLFVLGGSILHFLGVLYCVVLRVNT